MKTKEYYEVCKKHKKESTCYENEFFPAKEEKAKNPWEFKTKELTTTCADGYCSCSEAAA
jgi:hypothetical protein